MTAVEKSRKLIEDHGGQFLHREPCGCFIYLWGNDISVVCTDECEIDHASEMFEAEIVPVPWDLLTGVDISDSYDLKPVGPIRKIEP